MKRDIVGINRRDLEKYNLDKNQAKGFVIMERNKECNQKWAGYITSKKKIDALQTPYSGITVM